MRALTPLAAVVGALARTATHLLWSGIGAARADAACLDEVLGDHKRGVYVRLDLLQIPTIIFPPNEGIGIQAHHTPGAVDVKDYLIGVMSPGKNKRNHKHNPPHTATADPHTP